MNVHAAGSKAFKMADFGIGKRLSAYNATIDQANPGHRTHQEQSVRQLPDNRPFEPHKSLPNCEKHENYEVIMAWPNMLSCVI